MAFTVITAFPLTIGYGLSIFLIGMTYKMPFCFFPAYFGTLLGGMISFLTCRNYLQDYVDKVMSTHSTQFQFASHVIREHPVKVNNMRNSNAH